MVAVTFKTTIPTAQDKARARIRRGKAAAFPATLAHTTSRRCLVSPSNPRSSQAVTSKGQRTRSGSSSPRSNQSNELEQTYSLFSGGRAISENLQLDRPLPAARNAGRDTVRRTSSVKLDTLTGITVAEIDWKARNAGKTPLLDPLAAHIPADQHALFLPSPKAAQTVLSEFLGGMTPILSLNGSSGLTLVLFRNATSGNWVFRWPIWHDSLTQGWSKAWRPRVRTLIS